MQKFCSDIGGYPSTWSAKEIILDCIQSEAYLCGVKKTFTIDDISKARTHAILKVLGYDIKLLLKLQNKLDGKCREKQHNEPPEDYDNSEQGEYDNDTCDNCGWSIGRNHDCNSSCEGSELADEVGILTLSVDELISKIIDIFESQKKAWITDGFEIENTETHERKEKEKVELLYKEEV